MTIPPLFKTLSAGALVCLSATTMVAHAADTQLNLYNWSNYIGKDTISIFEKQTGIKVKYDVYVSDDELQGKLLAGSSGYDVVVPTSDFMAKQLQAGLYQKLDKSKLPNLANLDPALMKLVAAVDPGNQYGVPWAVGTNGLGYNANKIKAILGDGAPVDSWSLLFDPQYVSKLKTCGVSILDSASEVFPAALIYAHKDPNTNNPDDIRAAFEALKKIRPYITQFNSSSYVDDLANGDSCLAFGYSGDIGIAHERAVEAKRPYEVGFSNPKEGGLMWMDMMTIPKDAPHPEAALKWINYIEDPKTSAGITEGVFYATANVGAKQYLPPSVLSNPTVYPSPETLKTMSVVAPHPLNIMKLENRLWDELKTGD